MSVIAETYVLIFGRFLGFEENNVIACVYLLRLMSTIRNEYDCCISCKKDKMAAVIGK